MNVYIEECKKVCNSAELLIEYNKLRKRINESNKLSIYFLEEEIKTNKYYKLTFKTMCIFERLTIVNRKDIEEKRVSLTNIKDALLNINDDVCSLIYAYANNPIAFLKVCIVPYKSPLQEVFVIQIYDYIIFFKSDRPFLLPLFMLLNVVLYTIETDEELKLSMLFKYVNFNNLKYKKIKSIIQAQRDLVNIANCTFDSGDSEDSDIEDSDDSVD